MRILISTFGSYGDLYPYLAIGGELRRRGHQVTVATSLAYRSKVQSSGLAFHAVRPDTFLDDREKVTYMMDAKHGAERVIRFLASSVRDTYRDVLAAARQADMIVTHPLMFAAVLVVQKLRLPWVSSLTAPISLVSVHDPPVYPEAPWLHRLRFLGPRLTRVWMALGSRKSQDWFRPMVDLRTELGLDLPSSSGQDSQPLVLGMFSKLLAAPQRDWPDNTVITGFPFLEDGELPRELERFLDAGPPPIVFSLGTSAVATARKFYVHSLKAVERLGARAVLLTGSHEQGLPAVLPDSVIAVTYAPHGPVFSRAAAIVHHGGAGTTGQAMRASHPMLIVPFGHDQFDNAERVRRLGAAEVLPQSSYTAARAEARLRRLLTVPSYARAAAKVGGQVQAESGNTAGADAIEAFH